MADNIPADEDSSGSLSNLSLSDDDICDDGAPQSDTWIEELECALLADCDPATLKKICDGHRIPASLRPDYWRALLALNDAGKVKLTNEYDLSNQDELRRDCELLVEDISANLADEPLPDADKLRLKSDFESTLTTYVRARPELSYVSGNGWTDILRVLYNLQLSDAQLYQMFFRIVDRYIPRDLSPSRSVSSSARKAEASAATAARSGSPVISFKTNKSGATPSKQAPMSVQSEQSQTQQQQIHSEKSVQAYQLLRLLIQYHDPELCSILDSRKVTPNLYVKDWFCSLFARSCPPKLALHIWDMHFKMADPFLIFFAAIVMVVNASDELKQANLSQADMLSALKKMPSQLEEDDVEDLYYLVSNHYTNSTPRSIRSYSHLFFMDTFGATYSGNESPSEEGGSPTPVVDLKTCRLTSSLDLARYLCLPIVPAEIFALDTAQQRSSAPATGEGQSQAASSSSSPSSTSSQRNNTAAASLRYFLVDCRPAEQYNAGHLMKAFHLDCSLMLREPSSFATAVQALLEIQRQVVASKSNTGGQHLCFIGSGQDEEDRYVNMVVASFLQKYQKYVSIVFGGFDAIHDYVQSKSELKDNFAKYIVDHNEELCKACCSKSPEAFERLRAHQAALARSQQAASAGAGSSGGFSSAQSLFASTTSFFKGSGDKTPSATGKFTASNPRQATATATAQQLAQSGASMFDKFTTAFASKSSVLKERLVETLNNTAMPAAGQSGAAGTAGNARSHVDSHDRVGRRYTGGSFSYDTPGDGDLTSTIKSSSSLRNKVGSLLSSGGQQQQQHGHLLADHLAEDQQHHEEPLQEVQLEPWQRDNEITALYKCAQIKGTTKFPGYIGLNKSHLWILREIPHNKGFASIAAKRPLDMVVQITSKRRQPDFIIFRYGYANTSRGGSTSSNTTTGDKSPDVQSKQQDVANSVASAAQKSGGGLPTIIASDHLHIPQAFEVIRLIKREIVRIMDESSRKTSTSSQAGPSDSKESSADTQPMDAVQKSEQKSADDDKQQQQQQQEEMPAGTGPSEPEPRVEAAQQPPSAQEESANETPTATKESDVGPQEAEPTMPANEPEPEAEPEPESEAGQTEAEPKKEAPEST